MKNKIVRSILYAGAIAFVLGSFLVCFTGCGSPVQKRTELLPTGEATNFFVVAPSLAKTIQAVQTLNSATAPANPYSVPIQAGLAGMAGLAAWWARRKTAELNSERSVTTAVVQGVENAGDGAAKVKEAVRFLTKARGNAFAVDSRIQQILKG